MEGQGGIAHLFFLLGRGNEEIMAHFLTVDGQCFILIAFHG